MNDKTLVIKLLTSLYYMMGVIDGAGCKVGYDFVLGSMNDAEECLKREDKQEKCKGCEHGSDPYYCGLCSRNFLDMFTCPTKGVE